MNNEGTRAWCVAVLGLCVTLLVAPCVVADAQTARSYPLPRPFVEVDRVPEGPGSAALISFYPIGWSRDGKLAFLEAFEQASGDEVATSWVFTIQNMSNDQVLWTWRSTALPNWKKLSLEDLWNGGAVDLQRVLAGQGIQPANAEEELTCVTGNRFGAGDYVYALSALNQRSTVEMTSSDGQSSISREMVTATEVRIAADGLGSKSIYQASFAAKDRIVGIEPTGALVSPFEPRAAILVAIRTLGADSGEVVTCKVIGAHLTRSFR